MILTQVLTFLALSLTTGSPTNTFYQYGGQIECTLEADVNIDSSNNQEAIYFEPYVRFSADLSYDDFENYYLDGFRFTLYVDAYRLPRNASTPTLIESFSYSYNPNWEITQNSYTQQLERLKCDFELDLGNDLIWLGWYYDNTLVENAQYFEFPYTQSEAASSTFTFSSTSFFNQLDNLINSRYQEGFDDGFESGKQVGYSEGLADGLSNNGEMFTIFNGIINVAAIPINVFLAIFNFEVFGINITSLVTALLSVAILIIVIRLITGKKSE